MLLLDGRLDTYSYLNATIGSIRVARRAGMKLARSEIAKTITATVTNVKMSVGLTSKSKDLRRPVTANAPIRPRAIPAAARSMPRPRTNLMILFFWAPKARRVAISWVRCETEYAITPYNPIDVRIRAITANVR